MTIYLASDHAGFNLKEKIRDSLVRQDYQVIDLGSHNLTPKDDYPDYAEKVAKAVQKSAQHQGILICGSGEGVCIVANKFKGIRAVVGYSRFAAKQSRTDDDANVLCLPGRVFGARQAMSIVDEWLEAKFSGKKRYKRRLQKIKKIEKDLL